MSFVKQLSREDVMYIAGETSRIYQQVGVLIVLDSSEKPDFTFENFRQRCIERVSLVPQFRWKLHAVPMGLDRPYWVEDGDFNFDHHIKKIGLPKPGDRSSLCEVAAHLYSRHLDRNRPLWQIWLIEGLEDGKSAYLQLIHHCMMDGEGAFKMIEIIGDFEPEPKGKKVVDKAVRESKAGSVPSYSQRSSKAWQHLSSMPGEAARGMYDLLRPRVLEQFVWPRRPREQRDPVPTTCFNGVISSDRAVAIASLPMAKLKLVKNQFGVSLNDVVLALASSAVRNYLLTYAALPKDSLRTNMPVSLRTDTDPQFSNKVTSTTITLATNIDDPVARLQAINHEGERVKQSAHDHPMGVVELFQIMPPILVSTVMESLPPDQAPQILGANLFVSNVRGNAEPMYIAGARMDHMYPISILTAGMGVNITCVSYRGSMEFGIIVDPDLVPHCDAIATGLESGLDEYLALCKPKRKVAKKAVRKAKIQAKKPAPAPKKASRKRPATKKPAKTQG